ncbi:MAG: RNA polymerase sigma factor [Phycisphaerales bacterium]|nr:MAG: RNA polymerase sigma factor [Phycisphaerales bacterium]
MHEDEPQLIQRARAGDAAAAGEIVQRYQQRIYALCLRVLGDPDAAEEITQETLIKALTGLERFDGRSALGTWLHRIAVNACSSRLRSDRVRKARRVSWSQAEELAAPSSVQQDDTGVDAAQRRRLVSAGLDRISPEHRIVLVLRDVQGLEYEQIAEVLGVPVGTIKSRLFRARAALRRAIEQLQSAAAKDDGEHHL